MKIKCDYCGAVIDETEERCPSCGAPLSGANRTSDEQPKTMEQLNAWYKAHHLPPENITRFFIGKNITEPKAFGIYRNSVGDFVVYKNKANGDRVIRYQGADEAYAVNELYQRLKAEIVDQKAQRPATPAQAASTTKPKKARKGCLVVGGLFILITMLVAIFDKSIPNGYYNYQGRDYYRQGNSWYYYDSRSNDWYPYEYDDLEGLTEDNASDYHVDRHVGKDFESTSWYDAGSTSDDYDWDDDSDWGSSSDSDWDSGGTDWDSDW